jgi:putative ABC transport system permease protein
MPIVTLQNLSGQAGQINTLSVQADSIDNMSGVMDAIKQKLGSSVDVTSAQDTASASIQPLENIKTISLYSLIGSLIAGSIIIFLIMMMIVRERRREIGVLKAIGSSNIKIVSQFSIESLVLTISGSIIGIVLGFALSNPILKILVNSSSSNAATGGGNGPGPGRAMVRVASNFLGGREALQNLHAIVNYEIIFYGLLAAIVIAILGSIIPSFLSAKIRPAEVMRNE